MQKQEQQTAVEWYDNQLRKLFSNTTEGSNFSHEELLQQAREMEKEQHRVTAQDFYYGSHSFKNFEQYYNETYGEK
jgi:hypothetical protein